MLLLILAFLCDLAVLITSAYSLYNISQLSNQNDPLVKNTYYTQLALLGVSGFILLILIISTVWKSNSESKKASVLAQQYGSAQGELNVIKARKERVQAIEQQKQTLQALEKSPIPVEVASTVSSESSDIL